MAKADKIVSFEYGGKEFFVGIDEISREDSFEFYVCSKRNGDFGIHYKSERIFYEGKDKEGVVKENVGKFILDAMRGIYDSYLNSYFLFDVKKDLGELEKKLSESLEDLRRIDKEKIERNEATQI